MRNQNNREISFVTQLKLLYNSTFDNKRMIQCELFKLCAASVAYDAVRDDK